MAPFPARISAPFLAAVFLVAVASAGASRAGEPASLRPLIRSGEKAPAFTLSDLKGKRVAYRPEGGKPSLVVFWSAFCPLCRELTPSLNDIARRYGSSVRIVSVNLDGKRFSNAVQSFVRESGVSYPVLYDDIRGDLFIASDPYGIEKTPTAVLVDAAGTVRATFVAEGVRGLSSEFERIVGGLKKGTGVKK
ncbi:MAG: TlpA family protein disulfide reductase [Deltaproteobacteria bacterium]|nr:TlpA family protein disulfide reductase [Deltaproteobacteria bacterium]